MEDHQRAKVFESLGVDSTTPPGDYLFEVRPDPDGNEAGRFAVYYTNQRQGYENHEVTTGSLAQDEINLPGLQFRFTSAFRSAPHGFSFHILSTDRAIRRLQKQMTVSPPNRYSPDMFRVTLMGTDYGLVARTLNTIAEMFVASNSSMRRRRTRERLSILEGQLAKAERQALESRAALRQFLSAHPSASLEQHVAQTITSIANLQGTIQQLDHVLSEARRLRTAYEAEGDESTRLVGELLAFLEARGIPRAAALRQEYVQSSTALGELERTHIAGHPLIKEQRERIRSVGARGYRTLTELIQRLESERATQTQGMKGLSASLRRLPGHSMKLAELRRQQEINAEIYAHLQARYNEAKVADAVEMADVYVIDEAVAPVPPPYYLRLMRIIGFGLLAGVGTSLVLVLILDYLDRTALTEFEVSRLTDMAVLESIPTIKPSQRPQRRGTKGKASLLMLAVLDTARPATLMTRFGGEER